MACWLGDAAVAEARRIFEEAGVADYETPEEAVRAFAHAGHLPPQPGAADRGADRQRDGAARRRARRARSSRRRSARGREMLDELEAKAVLTAYGIPVVPTVAVGRVGRRRGRGGARASAIRSR